MKTFQFTLARMREFKIQLLNKEKNTLMMLHGQKNKILDTIENLKRFRDDKSHEMTARQQQGMRATDINAYRFYEENARLQIKQLNIELEELEYAIDRQTRVVVAASQEVNGLDKLEEKQRIEYNRLSAKEQENFIAEFVTQQVRREKSEF